MTSISNNKPIIALDCDGVLLDYPANFARIYEKTFGKQTTLVEPRSYYVSSIAKNKKQIFVENLVRKTIRNRIE